MELSHLPFDQEDDHIIQEILQLDFLLSVLDVRLFLKVVRRIHADIKVLS